MMIAARPLALVFATLIEAQPLLRRLDAIPLRPADRSLFVPHGRHAFRNVLIFICGMGGPQAQAALDGFTAGHTLRGVLNCGIAGSLTERYAVGDIVSVSAVGEIIASAPAAMLDLSTLPEARWAGLPLSHTGAHLVTQDQALFDADRRAALARHADLVDMEGAAIARICAARNIPLSIIKGVSDHAVDRESLLRNLEYASTTLADFLFARMARMTEAM